MNFVARTGMEPPPGSVLAWLRDVEQKRAARAKRGALRTGEQAAQAVPKPRTAPSKSLFLLELETQGDVAPAAAAAGCSVEEVRQWRASDQRFARDFVLAVVSHMKALTQLVETIARRHPSDSIRCQAAAALAEQMSFCDAAGTLDVHGWCSHLRAFAAANGYTLRTWEPDSLVEESLELEA